MMKLDEKREAIVQILQETAAAHHAAFIETDGLDPEWPLWYAENLKDKLPPLLETDLTISEITYLMVHLSKLQASEAPDEPWPSFYARYLEKQVR